MMSNWHSDKMKQMESKSIESLYYIYNDCREAAAAMQSIGNDEKYGQYADEAHYAAMEIRKREAA